MSSEVVEIWVEGLWLKYRTSNSLRTLRKIAAKGHAAYLRYGHGWVHLCERHFKRLLRRTVLMVERDMRRILETVEKARRKGTGDK